MNSKCKHIQEFLSDYCRSELNPSEMDDVKHHLQACKLCQQALEDTLQLEELIYTHSISQREKQQKPDPNLSPHLTSDKLTDFSKQTLSSDENERILAHLARCRYCAHKAILIDRACVHLAETNHRPEYEERHSFPSWWRQWALSPPRLKMRLVAATGLIVVVIIGLIVFYFQLRQPQSNQTLQLALADLRIGDYKSAQQLFSILPEDILKDPAVQFQQGMTHHIDYIASLTGPELTQHPERALDMYAILHIPPNSRTIENRQTEPLRRAIQHYRNCVKADEHNIDAWVALMLAYLRMGDLSEAQATTTQIESIPKIQKESAVYLNAQGILQLRGTNPNQAISFFERAIQVAEDQEQPFLDPYYNLALSYSLLDNSQGQQKAKEAWENYLLGDKNNDYWALQASEQYEQVCAKLQIKLRDDLAEFVEIPNNIQGIYFGKKADEITNIPADPTDRSNIGNRALWTYKRDHLMLEFQNNVLSRIVLLPGNNMSVYNIRLGSSTKEIESAIGLPARIEASTKGKTSWYYTHRGLTLEMLDSRVNRIEMTQTQIGG